MRKEREAAGIEFKAAYFEEYLDPTTGETSYKYGKRDYWADRRTKNWSHLPNLF